MSRSSHTVRLLACASASALSLALWPALALAQAPAPPADTPAKPAPQKAVVPEKTKPEPKPLPPQPKPEPKPAPKGADKAPPDKNGMKPPVPPEKSKPARPKPSDDFLSGLAQNAVSPSKAPTRTLPQANTRLTTGMSSRGSGPADAGDKLAMSELTDKLDHLWQLNCDVWAPKKVSFDLMFVISPNGRVISGPEWINPNADPVWQAAAARAKAAVKKGELYTDLPPGLYNRRLQITFDAPTACAGQ